MKTWWWIASGILLCVFLPAGIIMVAATILKEISEFFYKLEQENTYQPIEQNTYFEDTLKEYK